MGFQAICCDQADEAVVEALARFAKPSRQKKPAVDRAMAHASGSLANAEVGGETATPTLPRVRTTPG